MGSDFRDKPVFPPFDTEFDIGHVVSGCGFALLVGTHAWLNQKTIVKYFKGLGRWWILIGVGVAGSIVFEGIVVTILIAMGVTF